MTKWYNRVGNTIEMCVDGKWIKGIIVKGERSFDGIINMKTLTGQHCWCGIGGEGVHFRKCDDSDGDLITNADKIRRIPSIRQTVVATEKLRLVLVVVEVHKDIQETYCSLSGILRNQVYIQHKSL